MRQDLKDILDIQRIENFLIKIEDLSRIEEKVILYHPDDPRYVDYWRGLKKKCIEGFWIDDFDKKRYVAGRLYFYRNFCTILDVDQVQNTRIRIQPDIRDVEWLRSYMLLVAEGFSGWSKDDEFTSDILLKELKQEDLDSIQLVQPERYSRLLNSKGELKKYKEPWENVTELKDKDLGVAHYWNNAKNTIELGARGGGKMVGLDEPVLTPNGWVKMKDLEVEDKVIGSDGLPTKIKWKSDTQKAPFYRITLRDGRVVEACEDHTWKVWNKNKNKNSSKSIFSEMKTKDMFEKYYYDRIDSKHKKKYNEIKYTKEYILALPTVKEIEYKEVDLPINPYLLGLLLGDGCLALNGSLTTGDKEVIEFCKRECTKNNWTYRIKNHTDRKCSDVFFTNKNKSGNSLIQIIKKLGLYKTNSSNKFIPEIYKNSSIKQRYELLRGLMDSDGFADSRHIEYYTVSKKLSEDVVDVIRSLGINCRTTEKETSYRDKNNKKIKGKNCYRTSIYTNKKIFNLDRKQTFIDNNKKSKAGKSKWNKTFIVNIEPIGDKYGQCISVDNKDHTYIIHDYIVTHNSFWAALAISKYELVFNGLKYYNEETLKKSTPKAEVCIGSSRTDKSSDLVKKIVDSMEELASNSDFGTWGKVGDEDYTPSPFFKEMTGSYRPNNKDNLWRHEYQVNSNGNWRIKGSGSYLAHVTYSTQKKDGAEVAAGGRYGKLLYEEVGLIELLEEAYQSNKATVTVEGKQFGVQVGLGTSGNMETIIPAKKWFLNPALFDTVEFEDIYENSTTKIGFFLPAFLTHRGFKDKNGNTNVKEAVKHYLKRRDKYIKAKDAKGLEGEMMNYPIVPSEMFLSGDNNRLPIAEISDHIRDLNLTDTFYEYATVGELVFSSKEPNGVVFKPDNKAQLQPITTYPLQKGIPQDGAFVVYEHPITDASGLTPKDLYIIGHDPVAKDQTTNQGSFASIFVLKTAVDPIKYGYYELVAEYIGRPFEGREQVNELLEKAAMYYGVSNGMVFFENQVGNVVEYFRKRNKIHLLATQPQKVMNSRGTYTNSITYGYPMSNRIIKDNAIDYLADWLKEPRILGLESNDIQKNKMNLNFIKSPRLLAEFMSYNDKDNFDSVMGFLGCILGVREKFNQYKNKEKDKQQQDRIKNIIDEFKKDDYILNKRYEQDRKYKQGNQPFAKNFF